MTIQWTDELATGVSVIDDQHKQLFARINTLLEACSRGRGKEELGRVIQFLEDYVITHFSEEEMRMKQHAYPDYSSHRALHVKFIRNFKDLKEQFMTDGPAVDVVIKTNHIVVDWLTTHIKRVDKALGSFLKSKQNSSSAHEKII